MKGIINTVLVSMIVITLSSCNGKASQTDPLSVSTPDIGVPIQSSNYLEVTAPTGWNSFKAGDPIVLLIRNATNKKLTAKEDLGAKIFIFSKNSWVEVKNKTAYSNSQIMLDPDKTILLYVLPDLPDRSTSYHVKVFVVGKVIDNEQKTSEVASYIDLKLIP